MTLHERDPALRAHRPDPRLSDTSAVGPAGRDEPAARLPGDLGSLRAGDLEAVLTRDLGAPLTEDLGAPLGRVDPHLPGRDSGGAGSAAADGGRRVRVSWPVALVAAAVVVAPPTVTALAGHDRGWPAFSTQVGVLASAVLAACVVLVSRSRRLTRRLGIEALQRTHRLLAAVVIAAMAAHILVVIAQSPRGLGVLDPLAVSNPLRAGIVAAVALLTAALVFSPRLARVRYRTRRALHVGAAAAALVGVGLHIALLHHLAGTATGRVWLLTLAILLVVVLGIRWCGRPLIQPGLLVYQVRRESPSMVSLVLVPRRGPDVGLRFEPGQFVWLRLSRWPWRGEHPFSLASSAREPGYLELTVAEVGPFTRRIATLAPGTRVWLDGPHGAFTGLGGDGLVLIGGGSGLAPLLSMLRTLADVGDRRRHRLVVSANDRRVFADELDELLERVDLEVTWLDGRWIDPALLDDVLPATDRDRLGYFVCGPPAFTSNALAALRRAGIRADLITTEQY